MKPLVRQAGRSAIAIVAGLNLADQDGYPCRSILLEDPRQHGQCGIYSLIECGSALRDKVKQIDSDVRSLAAVINTQSHVWTFGAHLETSLKVKDSSAYIFAMTDATTGAQTFTLPTGVSGTISVVGENRTISATGGTFTDTFAAEYTHHIYKIALG